MGLLAHVLRPPCSSLPSSGDVVPMVPNLITPLESLTPAPQKRGLANA
jgi:hypothetical protein